MTRTYVITGGPGSGKTGLILAAEEASYYTIPEAAESVIRREQARQMMRPWCQRAEFQDNILRLQLQREHQAPSREVIIVERGRPEGLAYCLHERVAPGPELERELKNHNANRYAGVFFLEHPAIQEITKVRHEDLEEAMAIGDKILKVYTELEYTPIRIPWMPLDIRINLVLQKINLDVCGTMREIYQQVVA